eukprot:3508233-Amphidinium_carterae.1
MAFQQTCDVLVKDVQSACAGMICSCVSDADHLLQSPCRRLGSSYIRVDGVDGVVQTRLQGNPAVMFKSFLVRRLADALSDYLTGINAESVQALTWKKIAVIGAEDGGLSLCGEIAAQAGLGLDTGQLDLSAGIKPEVLQPLGLELLDSRSCVQALKVSLLRAFAFCKRCPRIEAH